MSFRLLSNRLVKHGRYFLQTYLRRDIYTNISEHGNRRGAFSLPKSGAQSALKNQLAIRNSSGIFRIGQHARQLFVDNVLNRVTPAYSADLRAQATKKLLYGDSAPFFALVGVSLASGAGVLTKEDELEGVCYEIREAASKIQNIWNSEEISTGLDDKFNLNDLNIGPPIAKGCAAVVYAASFKRDNVDDKLEHNTNTDVLQEQVRPKEHLNYPTQMMTPIQNMSRFVHNLGGSMDNLHLYNQGVSIDRWFDTTNTNSNEQHRSDENNYPGMGEGSNTSNPRARLNSNSLLDTEVTETDICRFPLALKMMFNYDIQSNAMAILRAMYKETIPARRRMDSREADGWEKLLQDQTLSLPAHPNIVLMYGVFCADVPNLRGGHSLYPMALPPRLNPQGYGRNMSLFLLMKRYESNLRDYLNDENINTRTRILLFAQLLEAVAHLSRHGVAHRDLKSDNILIEVNDDGKSPPVLVLSDFGCCIADKVHGLQLPYTSHDIDKGGNTALMAPEIITKVPGTFSVLNYAKSDLWACGAIGYEIFGHENPFYPTGLKAASGSPETKSLKNVSYKETDLPDLGSECPTLVKELITNILNPNPSRRLSPDVAANVMQLFLWAPSAWLKSTMMPSSPEILQWLLSLTTKVMCESRLSTSSFNETNYKIGRRTYTEYLLISSFLARARLRRIRGALSWIQSII